MRVTLRVVAAAAAAFAAPTPAAAAAPRPITIDPLDAPVAAAPFLLDANADIPLTGRAAPRAEIQLRARCSLRPCAMRVVADRRGRWKAKLHVVVPPHRTTLFVRAGPPLAEPTAERRVTLDPAPRPGGAPELALVGDSLAQGTGPRLPAALPGWRVTVDAVSGRVLWTGLGILDTVRRPTRRPYALAFSLFTNDHPSRAAELATAARQSVAGLPRGSCALWATIARPRIDGVSYAAANRARAGRARGPRRPAHPRRPVGARHAPPPRVAAQRPRARHRRGLPRTARSSTPPPPAAAASSRARATASGGAPRGALAAA